MKKEKEKKTLLKILFTEMDSRNATSRQQPVECSPSVVVLLKSVSSQLYFDKDDNENKKKV